VTVREQLSGRLASSGALSKGHDVRLRWISDSDDGPATWSELGSLDWSRFRLVLGAGGTTGAAFTAGVLLALATDHRVLFRNASHLVGTSAGSVMAALITLGLEGDDLAAVVAGTPQWLSPTFGSYDFSVGEEVPAPPKLRNLVRPMGPRDIAHSASLAKARRYRALWLYCVRPGSFALTQQLPFVSNLAWSEHQRLSVCCTDSSTGDRVIYERESGVELADALTASCAVPGIMRPVTIDNRVVVDGGVVSPTNADLALEADDTTTTVVVSPMSGTGSRSAIGRASSRFASSRLLGEIRRGHPAGGVLVIEPAARLGALVTEDALNNATTTQILAASFFGPSRASIVHHR
jgi:NTE family protein